MCDHLSFWVCPFFLMLFHKWNEYLWFNHWKDFTRKTTLLYSICLMGTILSYQPKTPKTYSFNNMKVHAHTANIFIRLKPVNWISGKQCLKLCNKYRSIVNCFKWYCNISGRTRGNAEEGVHVVDHAWPSDPDRGADGGQGAPRGRRQCYGDLKCVGRSGQETVP